MSTASESQAARVAAMADEHEPYRANDHAPAYVSPFGKPAGLSCRLAEWREIICRDRSAPWFGMGLIADLELTMETLRDFAEQLRDSPTLQPYQREFVDEILRNDETMEALRDALKRAGLQNFDPVAGVETLHREQDASWSDYTAVRAALVEVGALSPDDTTPVADLVRALLS